MDFRSPSCTKRQFLLSVEKGKERRKEKKKDKNKNKTKKGKKVRKRKNRKKEKKRKARGFGDDKVTESYLNISQVSGHNVLYQCQDICNSI